MEPDPNSLAGRDEYPSVGGMLEALRGLPLRDWNDPASWPPRDPPEETRHEPDESWAYRITRRRERDDGIEIDFEVDDVDRYEHWLLCGTAYINDTDTSFERIEFRPRDEHNAHDLARAEPTIPYATFARDLRLELVQDVVDEIDSNLGAMTDEQQRFLVRYGTQPERRGRKDRRGEPVRDRTLQVALGCLWWQAMETRPPSPVPFIVKALNFEGANPAGAVSTQINRARSGRYRYLVPRAESPDGKFLPGLGLPADLRW